MALSIVTYALSKRYTDNAVISASQEVIDEAVQQAKKYTDSVATTIEWKKVIVDNLPPASEADEHTIYFVPASRKPENDGYFEYMIVRGRWEVIGRTVVDMSDYYTKEEVEQYVLDHTYILPIASTTELGGIIIDESTIHIDNDGKISVLSIPSEEIHKLFIN